jgi:hypothetical protein
MKHPAAAVSALGSGHFRSSCLIEHRSDDSNLPSLLAQVEAVLAGRATILARIIQPVDPPVAQTGVFA